MKIGFFGLGNMGAPMARNLLSAGHQVVGYDVVPQAVQSFAGDGGRGAESVEQAAREMEAIITMLPSGETVKQLYLGEGGILQHADTQTLLIDSSTIAASDAGEVAQAAGDKGFAMLDAPVSGGVAGAQAGTLTFIVGGGQQALERAKPILGKMGKNIFYAGGNGAGQVAKMCNNMLLAIHMIGTSEALELGAKHGLDPKVLSEIMKNSSGDNWSLQKYNPYPQVMDASPASRDYQGGFGVKLMVKDLGLAQAAARGSQAQTPLGSRALELYQEHARDWADRDFSSILQHLK